MSVLQNKRWWGSRILFLPVLMLLSGCASVSGSEIPTYTHAAATSTTAPEVERILQTPSAKETLTLWLPAAFRPDKGSPGGYILKERLDAYQAAHPEVELVIRLKGEDGEGGIRGSLSLAKDAAPSILPDVVALDQADLRAAVLTDLIYDMQASVNPLQENNWYEYAADLVKMENAVYGMPFAGDAIVFASRSVLETDPLSWSNLLNENAAIHIPLADSRALFLFFGYYASGGKALGLTGTYSLEKAPLVDTLRWLQDMQLRGLLSEESHQLESMEAAANALTRSGFGAYAQYSYVGNSKWILTNLPATPSGNRFTMATGWAWALASPDPIRREKAISLLEWLADPQFLAEWTQAQGLLPASRETAADWPDGFRKNLAIALCEHAVLFPSDETMAAIGPVFAQAVEKVLTEGMSTSAAADGAIAALTPGD